MKTFLVRFLALALFTPLAYATTYTPPNGNNTLIGQTEFISANEGDTLVHLAQKYDVGLNAIIDANPGVHPSSALHAGAQVKVPTSYVLPPLRREGIIINLSEMRMYYFNQGKVLTYPIGIGRIGKTIPLANAMVTKKVTNPSWTPPDDIREFNEKQGIVLPEVMPPGPDNPLGPYAVYLTIPTFLIHSTIYPDSVGRRASFGCIRMLESDMKEFFPLVTPRTPVTIVDMPYKVGWEGDKLFLEAHPPLEERPANAKIDNIVAEIATTIGKQPAIVDWQLVSYLASEQDGMPHAVGFRAE